LNLGAVIAADCSRMRNPSTSIYDMTVAACTAALGARELTALKSGFSRSCAEPVT